MTLGAFWSAYHTPISLAIGPLLAYCIFRWLKIHPAWKIGLLLVAMLLTIGVSGILLNVWLAIALTVAFFIGSPAIWIVGIGALGIWGDFRYSELAWWKTFLICGVWWIVSMLLSLGLKLGLAFVFTSVQQTQEKPHEQ